jgi:hypothetical protein
LTINETDLLIIEHLAEHRLSDRLKAFLLAEFGKDGRREQIHACQASAYARCKQREQDHYECCGNCIPYREEPLLYQISEIIAADEVGLFDCVSGLKIQRKETQNDCF